MRPWTMLGVMVAVALTFGVGQPGAGEIIGTIQTVDVTETVYILEDGTRLWPQPGHQMVGVAPGTKYTIKYEERDGKKHVIAGDRRVGPVR